jgi:hypothetical protein
MCGAPARRAAPLHGGLRAYLGMLVLVGRQDWNDDALAGPAAHAADGPRGPPAAGRPATQPAGCRAYPWCPGARVGLQTAVPLAFYKYVEKKNALGPSGQLVYKKLTG